MTGRTVTALVIGASAVYLLFVRRAYALAPGGTGSTIPVGAGMTADAERARLLAGMPTMGPGGAPALAPVSASRPPSTSGAQVVGGLATGAATAGVTAATTAVSAATAFATFGATAAAGLLTWGITEKGWFRGGEEGIKVNPARAAFQAQLDWYGESDWPADWDGPGYGMAKMLTAITKEPNGSHYYAALNAADTMEEFTKAARDIQRVVASVGVRIAAP